MERERKESYKGRLLMEKERMSGLKRFSPLSLSSLHTYVHIDAHTFFLPALEEAW